MVFGGASTPAPGPAWIAVAPVTPSLAADCHVDRFDPAATTGRTASAASASARADGVGSYPVRALGQQCDPWGYDVIVYVVDGQPAPALVDLAERCPGVAWFVEAPRDHRLAVALSAGATAILRQSGVPRLTVDPGPFGRARPVVAVPANGASVARGLLEVMRTAPRVTRPAPAR